MLKNIENAKERFWDVVLIDMLINNNDRNEDNWGVIKDKSNNSYRLSPIYDCGNCFYGKTSEDRIKEILADQEKLVSSALNGITAYEDDQEKRIRNEDIVRINNKDLKFAIVRIKKLVESKMEEIIAFVNSIPSSFNGIDIMSNFRKEYYLKTFAMRFEALFKQY